MPNSPNRKNISLDKELVERFEYFYPHLIKIYLERALRQGIENKEIFEKIFFSNIDMEVIN